MDIELNEEITDDIKKNVENGIIYLSFIKKSPSIWASLTAGQYQISKRLKIVEDADFYEEYDDEESADFEVDWDQFRDKNSCDENTKPGFAPDMSMSEDQCSGCYDGKSSSDLENLY